MDADAVRAQPHHVVLDRLLGRQEDEADLRPPMAARSNRMSDRRAFVPS